MVNGWKVTAIVFMATTLGLCLYIGYSIYVYNKEQNNIDICYYEVCNDYVDAWYSEGVCYCYERDLLGELIVGKTKLMK